MNKMFMLIGFPGSGKSTYAKKLSEKENAIIYSSDELRKELYGSESVQDHNEEVFDILSKRMIKSLQNGDNIVYDAMNISSKYRRHFLQTINRIDCEKIAIIIATPYKECLIRNSLRDRKVPEDVIKRAYMNFNTPCLQEGFDEIKLVYPDDTKFVDCINLVESMFEMPQDNSHHTSTIGEHMSIAFNELIMKHQEDSCTSLEYATYLHDIGKPFTKTFVNKCGETTEDAHYYNHNNVGAYDVLFTDTPESVKLEVSLLVQYHMNYYMSWKQSEKAYEKDKRFLGEEFMKKLDILHQCDLDAH